MAKEWKQSGEVPALWILPLPGDLSPTLLPERGKLDHHSCLHLLKRGHQTLVQSRAVSQSLQGLGARTLRLDP